MTTASTTSSTGHATTPTAPRPGAASIAFVAVLFLGGSQDVIAGALNVAIGHVTAFLQFAALLAPPITYVVTLRRVPHARRATRA